MSAIAETEYARSEQLDNPESIYRACADMKFFNREVAARHFAGHALTGRSESSKLADRPKANFGVAE
jgi:hypothetical protein